MRRRILPVCLLLLATTALRAQVEVNDGTVTVRVLYQGQQITNCNGLLNMLSDDLGSFGCGATRTGQPAGNFTLREAFRPVVTPIPFTVVNGQTTIVDVELSLYVGEVTGTFLLNGQVPPPGTVTAAADFPKVVNSSGTDSTGRFRFLAFAGAGNGRVSSVAFPFTAVANTTVDVGGFATSNTGDVQVRVLYQGQPVANCTTLLTVIADNSGSFACGSTRTGLTAGSDTLRVAFHPEVTPIPFTITAGQLTTVDLELSAYVGEITGILLVNGAPPAPGTATAAADFPKLVNSSPTDATGRFRFLAFAGAGTGRAGSAPLAFTAVANTTVDIGTATSNFGHLTVRALYFGQPITNCNTLLNLIVTDPSGGTGSVGCGGTTTGWAPGNYSIREAFRPVVPSMPFTITAGQTTAVDVELSPYIGVITGTVRVNGAIPAIGTITAAADFPRSVNTSLTDATGRFRFLAFAGAGTGRAGTAAFSFLAVAGQTRDLGLVGVPTLDSAIVSKVGTVPARTWQIRILNTSAVNAATAAQLDNITFTQTTGAACSAPVVTTPLPVAAGTLAPGTNALLPVNINFGTCNGTEFFKVVLTYSATGGGPPSNRTFNLQKP
jgi:hypothetical protein